MVVRLQFTYHVPRTCLSPYPVDRITLPSMSSARWIWIPHREYVNQHLYLRKRFELASAPKSAPIRVTADTRYKLFVNGTLVVRGPARGFPQYQPVDELDIAPYLKSGPNVLAAHVL